MVSDWDLVKIEDIGDVKSGKRLPKDHSLICDETPFPYIRLVDVSDGRIRRDNLQYLTEATKEKIQKYVVNTSDVCLAIVGHTIGMVFYVDSEWDNNNLTENAARITNIREDVVPRYLYYFLTSPQGQTEILSRKVGSAQGKLPLYNIKSLEVLLPPLPEQKAIAHILGSLDDKIELSRQMNETLEAMAQALFKSWFVDFDPVIDNALVVGNTIPDEFAERAEQRKTIERKDNSDIQSLFPDEFEFTEEMGWIPKGWVVSNVGTEFDVTMGQSPPGSTYNELEEGIYFFQGSTDFGFRYPTPRIYCTEPKRLANKRDTLVSVRAPVGDTNLAAVDCCIGRGLAALRHKSGSASFTYYAMLQLKENFKIYEGEGTVFGSINQKDFKNLIQLKLPEILISEFEINAGALDFKIELNSLNIIALAKLRDTLLPKLMSGELRIPDAAALVDEAI